MLKLLKKLIKHILFFFCQVDKKYQNGYNLFIEDMNKKRKYKNSVNKYKIDDLNIRINF